jgi:hypothetical protein
VELDDGTFEVAESLASRVITSWNQILASAGV